MDAVKILQGANLKVTHQRVQVLENLMNRYDHPCIDEIYKDIAGKVMGLSKATVYNMLEQFNEKGIAEKIMTNDGKIRYDFKKQKHHHLYNLVDGTIRDFYDEKLNNILEDYFNNKLILENEIIDYKLEITVKTKTK